jgi:hypothetical protein
MDRIYVWKVYTPNSTIYSSNIIVKRLIERKTIFWLKNWVENSDLASIMYVSKMYIPTLANYTIPSLFLMWHKNFTIDWIYVCSFYTPNNTFYSMNNLLKRSIERNLIILSENQLNILYPYVLFLYLTVTDDSTTISIPVLQNEEQINLVPYFSKSWLQSFSLLSVNVIILWF